MRVASGHTEEISRFENLFMYICTFFVHACVEWRVVGVVGRRVKVISGVGNLFMYMCRFFECMYVWSGECLYQWGSGPAGERHLRGCEPVHVHMFVCMEWRVLVSVG